MEWHYAIGEEQFGPVTADELRTLIQDGIVQLTDLAWCPVMAQWQEVGSIRVLGIERPRKPKASKPTKLIAHKGAIRGIGGIC